MKKLAVTLFLITISPLAKAAIDVSMAQSYIRVGNYAKALEMVDAEEKRYGFTMHTGALRGAAYAYLGPAYQKEALKLLETAVNNFPSDATYSGALCHLYSTMGQKYAELTQARCERTLELTSFADESAKKYLQASVDRDDDNSVIALAKRAEAAGVNDYIYPYHAGLSYYGKKQYKASLEQLDKANFIVTDKKFTDYQRAEVLLAIANTRYAMGNKQIAKTVANQVIALDKNGALGARAKKLIDTINAPPKPKTTAATAKTAKKKPLNEFDMPVPVKKTLTPAQQTELANCKFTAEKLYGERKYYESLSQYEKCIKIQPADADAYISAAGIYIMAKMYDDAQENFKKAILLLPNDSSLKAYCYSHLGDIEEKQGNFTQAADYYTKAVEIDFTNVNAQIGLARYYEAAKEYEKAYHSYRVASGLEFSNLVAQRGFFRMEPYAMTDDEILTELKERKFVNPEMTELLDTDRDLFFKVRNIESYGGIEFFKKKTPRIPEGYITEHEYSDSRIRFMFTAVGYLNYRGLISKELIQELALKGVKPSNAFKMTDTDGYPLFDDKGYATIEGITTYNNLLSGEKTYLMPNEAGSKEAQQRMKQADVAALKLRQDGFGEITNRELSWLQSVTKCSEDTMKRAHNMKTLTTVKGDTRYFVDFTSADPRPKTLASQVMRLRKGDNSMPGRQTALFGEKQVKADYCFVCGPDGNPCPKAD